MLRKAFEGRLHVLHRTSDGRLTRAAFHMPNGKLLCDGTIRSVYGKAFRQIGLPWAGSHICRDTNATLALAGASLEAVRVNHGHASIVETEGYAKVHAMIENVVPGKVAELLFGEFHAQGHAQAGKGIGKGQ